MKKFFSILFALAVVGLFLGTLGFLYQKSKAEPIAFATETPFRTDIVSKTVATGSVVPRQEVEIKPQISGIVDEIFVEAGQTVKKGDVLAKVTVIPNMVALSNAENRVNRAHLALENAKLEHQRNSDLYDQGVVSQAELQAFTLALENAREEVKASEDNLALVREGARRSATGTNTQVKATTPGMVLEVAVEVGDSVIESNTFNDGTTIVFVADMDEMIFEDTVDESEVGKLEIGMPLVLNIGAIEDLGFDATLEYISPKGVEEDGAIQFEIRAALAAEDRVFIRANYSANADIVLDRRDDVLAVQEAWLQFEDGKPYVEVEVAEQEFERRDLETGLSDGINIEVLSGLDETARVKDPNSAGEA